MKKVKINDNQIDLTTDRKFCRSVNLRWVDGILKHINKLPWLCRPCDSIYRPRKSYEDYISCELGCTVRKTSNNKWFFAGLNPVDYYGVLFQSYLKEELGCYNDNGLVVCPSCGKLHFTKNVYYPCNHCEAEHQQSKLYDKLFGRTKIPDNYVPWIDYVTNTFLEIKTPIYRESILK